MSRNASTSHGFGLVMGVSTRWLVSVLWLALVGCEGARSELDAANTEHASHALTAGYPPPPRLLRDVAQVSTDGSLSGPGTAIAGLRTTGDGRIGVNVKAGTSGTKSSLLEVFLLNPEQPVVPSTLGLIGAEVAGKNWVELDLAGSGQTVRHVTVCDAATTITSTKGVNVDSYQVKLVGFDDVTSGGIDSTQVTFIDLSITVSNPKTSAAAISTITPTITAGPLLAIPNVLEPMFTQDGHLLIARAEGQGKFNDPNGLPFKNSYNIFYAFGAASCATGANFFTNFAPRPILYAPFDSAVTQYGFAAQPMRDAKGAVISSGSLNVPDLKGTYPWVDRQGRNLFFYTLKTTNGTRFAATCVSGTTCVSAEDASPTRGLAVLGSWTNGKTVLLDGLLNNIDYGYGVTAARQAYLTLYSAGPEVRFASGRENLPNYLPGLGHAILNPTIVDAVENVHNGKAAWKPVTVRDVVWRVSRGQISDEVVFDDLLDPNVYLNAPMNGVIDLSTGLYADGVQAPLQLQNTATSTRLSIPTSGQVSAGVRLEPAALGGLNGRGLYLPVGATASFPLVAPGGTANAASWYAGVFLDAPSVPVSAQVLRVGALGVTVDAGRGRVLISDGTNVRQVLTPLTLGTSWLHLGLGVTLGGPRPLVQVYLNGDAVGTPVQFPSAAPFLPSAWASSSAVLTGLSSGLWVDDFKIIVNASNVLGNAEVSCNHAGGTVYQSAQGVSSCRTSMNGGAPDHSGTSMRSALLHTDTLIYNQPRPDFTTNTFCTSCHFDAAGRPTALTLAALTAGDPKVPLSSDARRQPMMPPRRMLGVYPAHALDATTAAGPDKTYFCNAGSGDLCNVDRWFFPAP